MLHLSSLTRSRKILRPSTLRCQRNGDANGHWWRLPKMGRQLRQPITHFQGAPRQYRMQSIRHPRGKAKSKRRHDGHVRLSDGGRFGGPAHQRSTDCKTAMRSTWRQIYENLAIFSLQSKNCQGGGPLKGASRKCGLQDPCENFERPGLVTRLLRIVPG